MPGEAAPAGPPPASEPAVAGAAPAWECDPGCVVHRFFEIPAGVGGAYRAFQGTVGNSVVSEFLEGLVYEKLFQAIRELDVSTPFEDDLDYLRLVEFAIVAEQQSYGCRAGCFTEIITREIISLGLRHRDIVSAAHVLRDVFASAVKRKLLLMPKLPIALRVCKELGLPPVEVRAYMFILLCYGGVEFRSINELRPTVSNMAKYCAMSSHEFLSFLGDDREHFKQGLLGINDTHLNRFKRIATNATLTMPEEVVSAMYHVKLSEVSFLKLDKTCLAEIIQSEGLLIEPCGVSSPLRPADDPDTLEEDTESGVGLATDDEGGRGGSGALAGGKRKQPAAPAAPAGAAGAAPSPSKGNPSPAKRLRSGDPTSPTLAGKAQAPPAEGAEQGAAVPVAEEAAPAAIALDEDEVGSTLPTWRGEDAKLGSGIGGSISTDAGAYQNDLQYLEDVFKLLATQIRVRTTESDMKDDDPEAIQIPKTKQEAQLRELKGRERMLKMRIEKRMQKTRAAAPNATLPPPGAAPSSAGSGGFYPKMELLQKKRGFSNFEKMILLLLVGNIMSHDVLIAANGKYVMRGDAQRECTVGYLLYVLCETLQERVSRRKLFYKSAKLLRDGLITVNTKAYGASELMECTVDIDRRMVDSLMGLETEFSEIVEGSLLYTSTVPMDNVVLPKDHKETILTTITNYDAFQRCKKRVGLEDVVSYGSGLVLLFYGPSGTGKTMLANAIAQHMKKKVLVVALTQIKTAGRPELLKYVFREAKLNDAVVFFDECDSFFETREANPILPALLQELEKYNGIMILATNKAYAMDEAMNRRVTLAIEFANPDHHMRCEIWRKHIPSSLRVSDNVDFAALATDYELSGGLIKNALLTALSHAVAREEGNEDPLLKMEDFTHGAKTQLRSFFNKDLAQPDQVIPKKSLDDCIFEKPIREKVLEVIAMYKGRRHVQSMWGFGDSDMAEMNSTILLYGPSGVGKSLAAEAIGYECGHSLRVLNLQTLKAGMLEKTFTEVMKAGSILVIDEAQCLLRGSDDTDELVNLFSYYARKCTRPVILIARTETERVVDLSYSKLKVNLLIRFTPPQQDLREKLWRAAFPKSTPIHADVDLAEFAKKHMTPGAIKNVVFIASCKASMQPPHGRTVTKEILTAAAEEVIKLTTPQRVDFYT